MGEPAPAAPPAAPAPREEAPATLASPPPAAAKTRRKPSRSGQKAAAPSPGRRRVPRLRLPGGLSARLLLLTAAFVTLAGLLVLTPSLAFFEERWLLDRVRLAEVASLGAETARETVVSPQEAERLLTGAGVLSVAVQDQDGRRLLQAARLDLANTPDLVDLRSPNLAAWLWAPLRTLTAPRGRLIRVNATPRFRQGEFVEIVTPADPLKAELADTLLRLVGVTAFASALAGGLVYLSLNAFLVAPMQRITKAMERFRADPEDPRGHLDPSGRRDEIGRAELELDRMQADLRQALASRARLAALGEAVAKINHDLRNMLSSAQLSSERVAQSSAASDPGVARALGRLERSLDRAVRLASGVLDYGRSEEPAPTLRPVPVRAALEAAAEEAGLGETVGVTIRDPEQAVADADPDQLHRILLNLLRNAREALEGSAAATPRITARVVQTEEETVIALSDNGPGVPQRAVERLFQPFAGSARPGGVGLGLAISRELAQAHGGALDLTANGPTGATFTLRLPRLAAG